MRSPFPTPIRTAAVAAVLAVGAGLAAPSAFAQADLEAKLTAMQEREKAMDDKVAALRTEYRAADEARKKRSKRSSTRSSSSSAEKS
ncbi:MAG: hypothetical protein AAF907_08060 [Planctomycetota bacterium]